MQPGRRVFLAAGQNEGAVKDIDGVLARAEEARRRAADAVERSAELAEEHARRAEAAGDIERAEFERAAARKAREAVTESEACLSTRTLMRRPVTDLPAGRPLR